MAATLGLAYPSESVEAKSTRCFYGPVVVHREEGASPGPVISRSLQLSEGQHDLMMHNWRWTARFPGAKTEEIYGP